MGHRTAAIVSMGDELTLGQTLDTNSRWVSQRLVELGVAPVEHVTVPDDLEAAAGTLSRLAGVVDLVIVTGGLGPTADDLTRAALASAMGDELVEDAEALAQIEAWFRGRGREMPALNRVQAMRPGRAVSIENRQGTAPGLWGKIERRGASRAKAFTAKEDTGAKPAPPGTACDVFCLPGPPREMQPMFEAFVAPRIRVPAGRVVRTRVLHTVGIGESDLAARLGEMMERKHSPLVGTTASGGIVSIRIRYEGEAGAAEAERAIEQEAAEARRRAGDFVFGEGPQTLASVVVEALRERKERLAVVESCTGGMVGQMVTEVAGSSDVFWGGWITYANEAKRAEVGVPGELFAAAGGAGGMKGGSAPPGAVSREAAEAMARGGLQRAGVDHCVAVTGIAGPGGGTAEKPVGTVWIARASRGAGGVEVEARRFQMSGDRQAVREWSARWALAMLWLALTGREEIKLMREQERSDSRVARPGG